MNRREFCRRVIAVGGMMALGPLVKTRVWSEAENLAEGSGMIKIALVTKVVK